MIVTAPLIAVLGFAGLALSTTTTQAKRTATLSELMEVSTASGDLAYHLQRERAKAANLLTSNLPQRLDEYLAQIARTDQRLRDYQRRRHELGELAAGPATILDRVDRGIVGLASLRQQARSTIQGSVSAVAFGYRIIIADLLEYRETMAQAGAFVGLADDLRSAAALGEAIEAVGRQQVVVLRAVAAGQLTPAMQSDLTATRTTFTEASLGFTGLARSGWRAEWERIGSGPETLSAQRLQDAVGRAVPGATLLLDPAGWSAAIEALSDRYFWLQQRVDRDIAASIEVTRDQQLRRVGIEAGAMGIALLLTILVTAAVARQITQQLRRLRDSANRVAFERLPAVVNELRTASPGAIQPETIAATSTTGLDRSASDEIGEVAQAFTEVHRAAVRTAAEQAIMRSNMAEIFVHLSRREQRLVDAVLAKVDVVESDETDPERLRHLYELDNLATRMARVNASLLVLGGVGIGRVRREDVQLAKILQAALSQIQHYTRIRFGIIDRGVAIVADAVDDVAHLLAELMDNATMYSPPDSEAWVAARALGDRVIVQIGDEGVGLPAARRAQLNDLLTSPPAIDIAAVRSMGLVVVGHLAARFGARVELRSGPRLGTIAEVTLPAAVFRQIPEDVMALGARPDPADQPLPADPRGAELIGAGRARLTAGATPVDRVRPAVRSSTDQTPPPPWPLPPSGQPIGDPAGSLVDSDKTTELPIFQEVNSWFRPGAGQPRGTPEQPAAADEGRAGGSLGPAGGGGRQPGGWRTGADDSWRAAALASTEPNGTTSAGLPQRIPHQRLVPSLTDQAERQRRADHRDPGQVAAALAAYARGVAGRQTSPVGATTNASGSER